MSGYETSFTSDEGEVEASPEFQHDASDGGPQADVDQEEPDETKRLAEEPAGGIDGPVGFATDDPAPAP